MIVKPIKKNVLVAENKGEVKSAGGLILDGAVSIRESKTGTVLAVGPDVTMVEVGDKILLDWTKGSVVKIDDAQRVMISEDNIVAVMEK
jgi:co-chaperonin GroES (HSP10)